MKIWSCQTVLQFSHRLHLVPDVTCVGEKKYESPFALAEDRTRDPPHVKQNYHVTIKAGLCRKALQVCCIPNTTAVSETKKMWLIMVDVDLWKDK